MKGKAKKKGTSTRQQVRARSHAEPIHDTYKMPAKLSDPAVCSECDAVYRRGRWIWGARPAAAVRTVCPACRRIQDRFPGGVLRLSGPYLAEHREDILGLVRSQEAREKAEHPLVRIMAITDKSDGVEVTTTHSHLARRIGDALHSAHRGELHLHYVEEDPAIRAEWRR